MSPLQRILHLDQSALLYVRRWQLPWVTVAMRALTRIGNPTSYVLWGSVLICSGTRHGIKLGLRLGAAAVLATVCTQLLKRVSKRNRPDVGIADFQALAQNPDAFSFPSGHTGAAAAVAVAFLGEGAGLGAVSTTMAAGIGISRVYLGAHYPLDVIAGALIGVGAGVAARMLIP